MIKRENIGVQLLASDWKDAIRKVGEMLVNAGSTTHEYTEAMITAIDEMGPYIAILPGFALAHAAPGEAVFKNDIALISLKEGVELGCANDPIYIILCICCTDTKSHRDSLKIIAKRILDEAVLEKIKNAGSVDDVLDSLGESQ